MCQGFDPTDSPCGYCTVCDMELFEGDVKEFGNQRYLKPDEGHPVCPECGLIDIDAVVKKRTEEDEEDEG